MTATSKKKIAVIFGTRPDTIKLAPVITTLQQHDRDFTVIPIATAQHREMLDDVLSVFAIRPAHDLDVMTSRQSLPDLTRTILEKLHRVLSEERPDMVVVQGDTTTTFIAGLTAFYQRIPVAHVEAGLRTFQRYTPFPEELNRRLTTGLAELHFTPTPRATRNLLRERVSRDSIICTGNTIIDALQMMVRPDHSFADERLKSLLRSRRRLVIVTAHRRENWGEPLKEICAAVVRLAGRNMDVEFIVPVHRNPVVREIVEPLLRPYGNIHLFEPLPYGDFINLVARSYLVITDSGGLQEEGPALGKPVLVLRDVTERPEGLKSGVVKMAGIEQHHIANLTQKLLNDGKYYDRVAKKVNPYGDGKAAERIVAAIQMYFGKTIRTIREFQPRPNRGPT